MMQVRYITDEEISKQANSLICQFEKQTSTPSNDYTTNIEALALFLGLKFYYQPLEEYHKEYSKNQTLGVIFPTEKIILLDESIEPLGINKVTNERVSRFTLSHEIGHYILHKSYDPVFFMKLENKEKDRIEIQANRFASNLLMPEATFRSRHSYNLVYGSGNIVTDLSNDFNTSNKSTQIRIKELSL